MFKAFLELNIGGKKRPFKFGTNATALFCEERKCTLNDFMILGTKLQKKEITGSEIRDLLWAGLICGAKSKKKDVDFTSFDVGDWMDEMDQNELNKVFQEIGQQASASNVKKKVKAGS